MNTTSEKSRKGIMAALIFSGFFLGIIIGGILAAKFFVDKSAGLAGGVMVLFYALLFGLGLAIAGGIAGKMLPRPKALVLAWLTAPVGLLIMVTMAWRISAQQKSMRAGTEAGYASLLPYEVHVTGFEKIENFSYVYADNLVQAYVNNQVCAGTLQGKSRLALLTALRGIEGRTINCMDCDENSTSVTWQIHEANGDISSSEFYVSEQLMAGYPAVKQLLKAVTAASREIGCP